MATIKSFTDLSQSRVLAKILPLESADMWWAERYAGQVMANGQYVVEENPVYYLSLSKPSNNNYSQDTIKDIPCWSLAALYAILPNNKKESTTLSRGGWKIDKAEYLDNWWCEYEDNDHTKDFSVSADNPIDACYAMILKLHEMKML